MEGRNDTPDEELVEKIIAGDKAAFGRLVEPHLPRLLGLARRMLSSADEAEDALQNALASVWMARAKLDPRKPVAAYLTTVTLNKFRDRLRRQKVVRLLSLRALGPDVAVAADEPGPDVEIADRQLLAQVTNAIDRLPLRLREALVLVAIEGRSHGEVAKLLGVTEKSVETRVYRARQRLRNKIDFL